MTDFYVRVPSELSDYKSDQTVIIKKRFLKHISRVKYEEETSTSPAQIIDWYPFTNSYYPYTEDVDAFARVNHLLATKNAVESFMSIEDANSIYGEDAYSEKLAQLQYLSSNPVSFLILGKPDIGQQELGKLLADHWKCVYIEPETLIIEEINSGSRAGQCIEFNLRCGRAIGVDIILRLVEKRVKSKSAQHRGFVICGLPLIANDLYQEDPVSSESAVFNVQEIFEEIFETTIEVGVPPPARAVSRVTVEMPGEGGEGEEEESIKSEAPPSRASFKLPQQDTMPLDVGSAILSNICVAADLEKNVEEQIDFIFSQFQTPFLVIYVMCSNNDVISKHKGYRFDVYTQKMVDLLRERNDKTVYTLFSTVPGARDEMPEDFIDLVKSSSMVYDSFQPRQLVKLPRNFPANTSSLLNHYHYSALPTIEKYVLMHDVQYFFKVDGRISPVRMFNAVKTKLRVLPLQRVVLPEKLLVPGEVGGEGDAAEDLDVESLSIAEIFEQLRKRQIASPMFKWGWSDWGLKCPVSMKEGGYKDGDPKFAVHFMNKVFFLADEDAYIKFYRNPRLYLLPPFPKPSGRIFVMGTPYSGKTAVSRCLGYLLKAEVLNYSQLTNDAAQCKKDEIAESIRSAALVKGMEILNEQRKLEWVQEQNRRVEEWVDQQVKVMEEVIAMKEHFVRERSDSLTVEMSSFPITLSYNKNRRVLELGGSSVSVESTEVQKFGQLVEDVQKLLSLDNLPTLQDIDLCEELVADREKILTYLPSSLQSQEVIDIKPASIFDDFVKEYADSAVKNASFSDIYLSSKQILELLKHKISEIEERNQEHGSNKGGWIVDGMPCDQEVFQELVPDFLPDDIFVLRDTDNHDFLLERFETRGQNDFRDFRQFFMDIGNADAAWRSPSLRSTASYKSCLVRDILGDVLDEAYIQSDNKVDEQDEDLEKDPYFTKHPRRTAVEAYKKELNEFDTDWSSLRDKLLEFDHKFTITEVSVTDKTFGALLKEVVKNTEDRYRQLASVFTSEDRLQELEDFGEPEMQGEDIGEEKENTEDLFFQNRRFGDTFNYCPVTFHNHWVLWKGKEEYTAKFENKLYLMCNEEAMSAFIQDPRSYLLGKSPPKRFPPPRICIVGPTGSGKTTVVKTLCKNLGLFNVNYAKLIKNHIAPNSSFELGEILKMGVAGAEGDMVLNYFVSDQPLADELLNAILLPLWFEDPVREFGFILDGFPMRPSDVDYMVRCSAIPDIVVELSITQDEIHKRLIERFIDDWQNTMNAKQEILNKKHEEIINAWEERRTARFKELMELKRAERYAAKVNKKESFQDVSKAPRPYMEDLTETDEDTDQSFMKSKSQISYDSVAEEADIEEINRILAAEMPDPVFEEEADESLEDALERFTSDINDSYGTDVDFLRIVREQCESELIPWITVDAGMPEEKVFTQVMRLVEKFKFRNESVFERVYDISVDLADKLLSTGYYFLSRFGKTCPVQIYENINPVQMFLPLEQKFQLFPVIHRQYIYFLAKNENREKFRENPLKYTSQNNVKFPLLPLKLAVIGPPKSGKTTLAERFKRDLGMKVISRGQAGRYVLNYLEFSELAENMESVLRQGWELTTEMVIKCVEAIAFDGKSITQGFVLDGFPSCIDEIRHLAEVGLVPHLVIDLQAEHPDIYEFLGDSKGKHNLPVFSKKFVDHRYDEWLLTAQNFRQWLDKEYQILAEVPVKPSKWGVWTTAFELATDVFSEIQYYHKFAYCDIPLRLANMQVTPLEFIERQGCFKAYCPGCLYYENALVSGGDPPDRTGVVQFRKSYYHLCHDHIDEFVSNPEPFLPPYNPHMLPADLPIRVYLQEFPDNCYEDAICIVCYWENQPRRVVLKGELQYGVLYREKVYFFNDLDCMNKFMRTPHKFYSKAVNFKGIPYPSLSYKELPTLGLLEQYDARQLIRAISNTGILRPVVPGLSIASSASLNVGLYLKLYNPRTPKAFRPLYEAAQQRYHDRRLNLIHYLAQMKKMINPYLYYDEPMPKFVDPLFSALQPVEAPKLSIKSVSQAHLDDDTTTTSAVITEGSPSAVDVSTVILDEIIDNLDYDDD